MSDFNFKHMEESLMELVNRAVESLGDTEQQTDCHQLIYNMASGMSRQFNDALVEVKTAQFETIEVLARISEYRDWATAQHNRRIGFYSNLLAVEMGQDYEFCEEMLCSAPLHDIGKVAIPDCVLLKKFALTGEEFDMIKSHTTLGAQILSNGRSSYLKLAREIAMSHHEKWDGSGYPAGLKGEDIPLSARIVAIADHYDAMRSNRPYKEGFSHDRTMSILTVGDGRTLPGHFDPEVLEAFTGIHDELECIFNSAQDDTSAFGNILQTTDKG
jgi:putative two-component system response regulator